MKVDNFNDTLMCSTDCACSTRTFCGFCRMHVETDLKSKPWTRRLNSAPEVDYTCYPWLSYRIDLVIIFWIFCCLSMFASGYFDALQVTLKESQVKHLCCTIHSISSHLGPATLTAFHFLKMLYWMCQDGLSCHAVFCRRLKSVTSELPAARPAQAKK